ncbi:hypothetical protein B9G69_011500 [Bdellovibrio sp. SKB1291214]|uniref:hypothetical protein n=1 Tax=Bdellovibrio sp. SKB1291214 TaxID=1732569 RepID=UPI000B51A1C7|nr:hypothetical protein [Bdellovibrio sp. SKB1291214]UYL10762.1 hypothetical protein B9G69_011500 [Bdellovibrio sp. SKB1291214]
MASSKIRTIKKIVTVSLLGAMCWGSALAQASVPASKTRVVYFGLQNQADFELKVKPVFDSTASCKNCEIINYTPYTADGAVDEAAMEERIGSLPADTSFVFFDFNLKSNDQNKALLEALNKRADSGMIFVGSAGVPKSNEASGPLTRTILGQVHNAVIIGELGDRDRLVPSAFYGPEMLTAIRPPKDKIGQGYSPLIFAANLAEKWNKRSPQEWTDYFKSKKQKNRKIWMDLNDLF